MEDRDAQALAGALSDWGDWRKTRGRRRTRRLETYATCAIMKLLALLWKKLRKRQGATVVDASSTVGASALKGSTHPTDD